MKSTYWNVWLKWREGHQWNKVWDDQKTAGCTLHVGDRDWLYVPVVKHGRTMKLPFLWHGPLYRTQLWIMNYWIQPGGSGETPVLPWKWLKICYGESASRTTQNVTISACNTEGRHTLFHFHQPNWVPSMLNQCWQMQEIKGLLKQPSFRRIWHLSHSLLLSLIRHKKLESVVKVCAIT